MVDARYRGRARSLRRSGAIVLVVAGVWTSSASGFGYVAQWGCPIGQGGPVGQQFSPNANGISVNAGGLFVADGQPGDSGVIWLDPVTLALKGRWNSPQRTGQIVVGAGSGGIFAHDAFAGANTVDRLAVSSGQLTSSAQYRIARLTAIASYPSGGFLGLAGDQRQIVRWDASGMAQRKWYLGAQDPPPVAFTGRGVDGPPTLGGPGGPLGVAYVAETLGNGTSRVAIYQLQDYPDGEGPTSVTATQKAAFSVSGTVTGIKSTADSLWMSTGAGTLLQTGYFGEAKATYGGNVIPGGLGPLVAVTADENNNVYVLEAHGANGTGHVRVIKLSPSGGVPKTGGGSKSPSLQTCGASTTSTTFSAPVGVDADLVSAKHPIKQGKAEIFLECTGKNAYCDASATATTYIPTAKAARAIEGKEIERRIKHGTRAKLKVPLPKSALRAIRHARARGRRTRVEIYVFASNPTGNKYAHKFLSFRAR